MLRAIVFFVLGFAAASAIYFSGAMQWMPEYASNYWNAAPPLPPPDAPAAAYPTASYPGPQPAPLPAPYPAGQDIAPPAYDTSPSSGTGGPYAPAPEYGGADAPTPDYGGADTPAPDYGSTAAQPVGPPLADAPSISIHVSIGQRNSEGVGCAPAYTIINDTHRPIALSQGVGDPRSDGRGPRDEVIVQPGEQQVACASDVYPARDGESRFDYHRPNVWYGPDAADVPLPVNIRVKD